MLTYVLSNSHNISLIAKNKNKIHKFMCSKVKFVVQFIDLIVVIPYGIIILN